MSNSISVDRDRKVGRPDRPGHALTNQHPHMVAIFDIDSDMNDFINLIEKSEAAIGIDDGDDCPWHDRVPIGIFAMVNLMLGEIEERVGAVIHFSVVVVAYIADNKHDLLPFPFGVVYGNWTPFRQDLVFRALSAPNPEHNAIDSHKHTLVNHSALI